jgi:hypothetical protein
VGVLLQIAGAAWIEYRASLDTLWDYYFRRAVHLVERGTFAHFEAPTALFPPGYSFLLAPFLVLLGTTKWAIVLCNMSLLTGVTFFLRWLLRRMGTGLHTANIFALFLFAYPTRFFSVYIASSDVPYSLFAMASFGLLVVYIMDPRKTLMLAVAAALAGSATLIRPTGFVLLVVLMAGVLGGPAVSGPDKLRNVFLVGAMFILVLLPWTMRNAALFHGLTPVSTNFGYNLLSGNNPRQSVYGSFFYPDTILYTEGNVQWNERERDAFWTRKALSYIAAHPVDVVVLGLKKILRTFSSDSYSLGALRVHTNFMGLPAPAVTMLYTINNFLYYCTFLAFAWSVRKRWPMLNGVRFVGVLLVALVAATVFVTFGLPRFKEPFDSVALLLLAVYLHARRNAIDHEA